MDISQFLPDLGTGFIGGAIIGWGIKKAIKIVVALVGLYFLSLLYLAKLGVISINKEAFTGLMGNVESSIISYGSQAAGLIHSASLGTGFVAGFALGFKKG
ncbi:FUN14 family protein [Methanothermococcus okinawensis IH1]|uniref:FUN14 family protein n=2 Tax=Methanothermococcus okinawensis TaxID=155863 RepID=F8ANI5_METOI|nr:FUN14 family protein [Methanothermococcus okinawensis IH1]